MIDIVSYVLGQASGGGGSAVSDLFLVTVTYSSGTYSADHTFEEIIAAITAGKLVVAQYSSSVYLYRSNTSSSVTFYNIDYNSSTGDYGGFSNKSISINSSNRVTNTASSVTLASPNAAVAQKIDLLKEGTNVTFSYATISDISNLQNLPLTLCTVTEDSHVMAFTLTDYSVSDTTGTAIFKCVSYESSTAKLKIVTISGTVESWTGTDDMTATYSEVTL